MVKTIKRFKNFKTEKFFIVFIVKNNELVTAPADEHILGGITRAYIIKRAVEAKISVIERKFTTIELFAADEVFITGSTSEILAVKEIDGKVVGGENRPIYSRLRRVFSEEMRRPPQESHSMHRKVRAHG